MSLTQSELPAFILLPAKALDTGIPTGIRILLTSFPNSFRSGGPKLRRSAKPAQTSKNRANAKSKSRRYAAAGKGI